MGNRANSDPGRRNANVAVDTDLGQPSAIYVGTGGDLLVWAVDDEAGFYASYKNVPDGFVIPVQVKRIISAGKNNLGEDVTTTAADFVKIHG